MTKLKKWVVIDSVLLLALLGLLFAIKLYIEKAADQEVHSQGCPAWLLDSPQARCK